MTLKDRLGTCLSLIIRGKELALIGVAKINEKFPNVFSFQIKEQNCHFEPEIRELKMKNRPKKAKKYSHARDCKEQPRETCNQDDKKTIQPLCETQERLVCTYGPEETCKNIDEQYCHKVEKVVIEEVYASKSRRIPMLGSHPEGKEEGEMGDNMRCLYTKPRSVHCGDNAALHYRMSVQRGDGCDVAVPA